MATITVNQVQELGEYGKQIKESVPKYREAVANAYHQFEVKYHGSKGDTIKAFIDKLNTIQNQIFEVYPNYLDNFGTTIVNYESGLSGLGFSTKAWSRDGETGAQGVQKKLTGDQKDKIETIQQALDGYFATAAEILGSGKISVSSVYEAAADSLDTAGKNRNQVDTDMQEYYSSFMEGLKQSRAELNAIVIALNNARHISSLEPSAVVNAIADGRLTNPEDIEMLDAIQDSSDAAMLTAILSDDKFREMGKVDGSHLSLTMAAYAYAQFFPTNSKGEPIEFGGTEYIDQLNAFIGELQKQQPDKVQGYMEKLSAAGAQQGYILISEALRLFPDFPGERTPEALACYIDTIRANNPEMAEISKNLRQHAHLSGLFDSVYLLDVGTTKKVFLSTENYEDKNTISELRYTPQGFVYTLTEHHSHSAPGEYSTSEKTFDIAVDNYLESGSINFDQMSEKITKLEESKKQAVLDFVGDVAQAGVYLLPVGTTAKVAMNVFGDIAKSTGSKYSIDYADYLKDFKDAVPQDNRTQAVSAFGVLKAPFKLYQKLEAIDKEIEGIKDNQLYDIFNVGGVSIKKDGTVVKTSHVPAFDLDAFLTMKDLADSGLSGHVYRQALLDGMNPEEALKELNDFEKEVNDSEILTVREKNFALGRSNQPVNAFGAIGKSILEGKDSEKSPLEKMSSFNAQEIWKHYNKYGRAGIIQNNSKDDKKFQPTENGESLKSEIQKDFNRIAQGGF